MRVSFKKSEQKKNYARELFEKGLGAREVQAMVVAQFGHALRRNTIYELLHQVRPPERRTDPCQEPTFQSSGSAAPPAPARTP